MLRVFLVGGWPRRLPRDAGRAGAHRRQRTADRLGPARRRQQGHLGAVGRAGRALLAAAAGACAPTTSSGASGSCRAAPPSTCSGWGATPSAARTARGCCAPCSRACRTPTALLLAGLAADRADLRAAGAAGPRRSPAGAARARGGRAPTEFERALIRGLVDPETLHSLRVQRRADRARGERGARSLVIRQLAGAEPACRATSPTAPHGGARRNARGARPRDHRAGRRRRPRDGAHDARRRLAVPEPGPAPRAAAVRRDDRGEVASSGRRRTIRRCSSGCSILSDSLITYRARYMRHPRVAGGGRPADCSIRATRASAVFQLAKLAKHAPLCRAAGSRRWPPPCARAAAAWERADVRPRRVVRRGRDSLDCRAREAERAGAGAVRMR